MNFKKFISGVSALAIAASAFAGMAVTANAATSTLSWVNTDGTYGYSSLTTAEDSYLNTALGNASVSKAIVNTSRGSGIYTVLDNALTEDPNGNLTIEFGLDIAGGNASGTAGDTTQTFCFMSSAYEPTGRTLQSVPSSNVLFTLSKTTTGDVYLNGDQALSIPNGYNTGSTGKNGTGLVKYKAVFDFNNDTLDLYVDKGSGYSAAISDDLLTTGANGLYGIFVNSSNKRAFSGFSMTDIDYVEYVAGAATTLKLSFRTSESDPATEVKASSFDISGEDLSGGQTRNYYLPAYINVGGDVYSTGITSEFARTATLAEGTTTVPVVVTAVADAQYVEFDGEKTYANRDNLASNGEIVRVGATHTTVLTVANDGVYKLTLATAPGTNTSGNRDYFILINDETEIGTGKVGFNTASQTYEDIELKSGDVITYYGNNSSVGIDYILIEKTGDIASTTNAGYTFMSTIDDVAGKTVTLRVTANNGEKDGYGALDITDKIENYISGDGSLMLAVIISGVEAGVEITSAEIVIE